MCGAPFTVYSTPCRITLETPVNPRGLSPKCECIALLILRWLLVRPFLIDYCLRLTTNWFVGTSIVAPNTCSIHSFKWRYLFCCLLITFNYFLLLNSGIVPLSGDFLLNIRKSFCLLFVTIYEYYCWGIICIIIIIALDL